jgi:hypothetical protein
MKKLLFAMGVAMATQMTCLAQGTAVDLYKPTEKDKRKQVQDLLYRVEEFNKNGGARPVYPKPSPGTDKPRPQPRPWWAPRYFTR